MLGKFLFLEEETVHIRYKHINTSLQFSVKMVINSHTQVFLEMEVREWLGRVMNGTAAIFTFGKCIQKFQR